MHVSMSRPFMKLAATVALAGMLGLSGGTALAQEATPIDPGTCVAPESTPAVLASPATGTLEASPVADDETTDAALAAAEPVEDEAVVAEATAAIENLYACANLGDAERYISLHTDEFAQVVWGDIPADVLEQMFSGAIIPPASNIEVLEVLDLGDGRIAVEHRVTHDRQVLQMVEVLVERDGFWLLDDVLFVAPETELDSTTAAVKISGDDTGLVVEVSPSPIMNQPAVKLQINNQSDGPIFLTLLQGDAALLSDPVDLADLPDGVTYVGEQFAGPGEHVLMLFEGLEEGSYVVLAESGPDESEIYDLTIEPAFDPSA